MYRSLDNVSETREEILSRSYVVNALESRICLQSYKAHYVEETEDVYARLRNKKGESLSQLYEDKRKKFHEYLNVRLKEIQEHQSAGGAVEGAESQV